MPELPLPDVPLREPLPVEPKGLPVPDEGLPNEFPNELVPVPVLEPNVLLLPESEELLIFPAPPSMLAAACIWSSTGS